MKKLAIVLLLAAAAAGGWAWWKGRQKAAAPAYTELSVERGELLIAVQANGGVQPRNRLEVRPPLAGRVEQVLVREGDHVKRGQILAWLSSAERAALLDAARAQGPEALERWEQLYKATPLLAPISGDVIARNTEPGQSVSAADAVVVLSDRLIVKAQVDETDIARVRSGQAAVIRLDAYSDQPLEARVGHIAFEAKVVNNVTLYEVEVHPSRAPRHMRSGMSASVDFIEQRRQDALLLPVQAVRRRKGGAEVLVPGPQGAAKPVSRAVKTGLDNGELVEILAGLKEGDTVLQPAAGLPKAEASGGSPLGFGRPPAAQSRQARRATR